MFETTLEAQALDTADRRLGNLSAAVLAHVAVLMAILAATALIVRPVPDPPDLHRGLVITLPPAIPLDESAPPPSAPRPKKGNGPAGAALVVRRPPVAPIAPPIVTPDELPDTPPTDTNPTDATEGIPGDPDGAADGIPGGPGTEPTGGGNDPNGASARELTGEMERPVLLAKIEPVYPTSARIARLTGRVVVEAVIGLDGNVESAEVISSTSPLFDASAVDAVRLWRYRPALMNGRPVRVYFKVAVEFVIR